MHEVAIPHASAKKKEWLYGMIYGLSQGIIFFAYAATFQFGGYLIEKEILPPTAFQDIFKVLMAVVFGAMSAGQSSAFAPDFGEAKLSALRMIKERDYEMKSEEYSLKKLAHKITIFCFSKHS